MFAKLEHRISVLWKAVELCPAIPFEGLVLTCCLSFLLRWYLRTAVRNQGPAVLGIVHLKLKASPCHESLQPT